MTRVFLVAMMVPAAAASAQDASPARENAAYNVGAAQAATESVEYACNRSQQPRCAEEAYPAILTGLRAEYAAKQAVAAARPAPQHNHGASETVAVPAPSRRGAADWKAPFPIVKGLRSAWGTGKIPRIYSKDTGAFRFTCAGNGPLTYDDPIVYPGRPGAAHGHLTWGSLEFDAFTDGKALAGEPRTNCSTSPHSLNRSSYWIPWLEFISGANEGKVLRPWLVSNYYKRPKSSSPACIPGSGRTMGICVDLPNELRIVAGWDMLKPDQISASMSWYCSNRQTHHKNLDALFASGCPTGERVIANVILPSCWDGKHLDVPDHRSHMVYPSYGSWGYPRCPSTHPYVIPTTEYKVTYVVRPDMSRVIDGVVHSNVRLSSDSMKPNAKPGETLHGDYFEKWDARAKAMWHEHCIEKGLDCSGGDLGNGWQLTGGINFSDSSKLPHPVVAKPPRPSKIYRLIMARGRVMALMARNMQVQISNPSY